MTSGGETGSNRFRDLKVVTHSWVVDIYSAGHKVYFDHFNN